MSQYLVVYTAYASEIYPTRNALLDVMLCLSRSRSVYPRSSFYAKRLVTLFPTAHPLHEPGIMLASGLCFSVRIGSLPEYADGKCQAPSKQRHHQNPTQSPNSPTNNRIRSVCTLLAAPIIIRKSRKGQC
jgi:hypothetical protein